MKNVGIVVLILVGVGFIVSSISNFSQPVSNTEASTPVDTPKVAAQIEKKDIRITFQTVKKVENKYRYFFDIRNHDSEPIRASVKIELLKDNGSVIGRETFEPTKVIEPGYGDSVYFDISTGPVPDFNQEFAVTKFRFEATMNENIVSTGEGEIGL